MRIKRVEAIPVRVRKAWQSSSALGVRTESTFGIVAVETDTGDRGLGEIAMFWNGGGAALCPLVRDQLAPAVVGLSPLDLTQACARMDEAVQFSPAANPAKAAVEMALYDLVGRAWRTPVYNLLGGRMRERVVLSISVALASVEEMVEQAREFVCRGFRGVKLKVGRDPDHDVAVTAAIRQAVGERTVIRLDANMGWRSAKEALGVIRKLAPLRIHSVEQPLRPEAVEDLALLRARSPIPIMVDESVWGPEDAYRVIRDKTADILNVYVSEAGGLRNALRIFDMAESAGLQCTIGSMPELGIGTAACAHLGAAVRTLSEPADVCGFLYYAESLIRERWEVSDGTIAPPEGPGLGVTLDEDRLAALRID
ncbi:MAG: dipeptide epimerase [Candidatus Rokubacteria bacterium]|nr:dipeptide epimerase [Candidatus Rokubacteria bacterium]